MTINRHSILFTQANHRYFSGNSAMFNTRSSLTQLFRRQYHGGNKLSLGKSHRMFTRLFCTQKTGSNLMWSNFSTITAEWLIVRGITPIGKKAKKTFLHMKMSVRTLFCGVGRGNIRRKFSENYCIVKDCIAWWGWGCSAALADVFRYLLAEAGEDLCKTLEVYSGLHLMHQQHS